MGTFLNTEQPALFRAKPNVVEAMLFSMSHRNQSMLATWLAECNCSSVWRSDGTFSFTTSDGEVFNPRHDEVIVRKQDGKMCLMSTPAFFSHYENLI